MTPTINQYLLDLFATAQLSAAQKTKDQKVIAKANAKYKNLVEAEVKFGPFVRDEKTGKYTVTVSSNSRGWGDTKVSFNTGTIAALSRKTQQGGATLNALDLVTTPTLLYVDENDSRYLAVEKDTNIFEALKLTGYGFPADSFVPTIYGTPDADNRAVGHVDLEHPIVVGRFFIYWIGQPKVQAATDPVGNGTVEPVLDVEKNPTETETGNTATEQVLTEGAGAPTADDKPSESAPEATGTEEPVSDENTSAEEPVDNSQATKYQSSKKK